MLIRIKRGLLVISIMIIGNTQPLIFPLCESNKHTIRGITDCCQSEYEIMCVWRLESFLGSEFGGLLDACLSCTW